jgi:hypothetical protein
VGLFPNQQGQAASHLQASSNSPVIFHGADCFSSPAREIIGNPAKMTNEISRKNDFLSILVPLS